METTVKKTREICDEIDACVYQLKHDPDYTYEICYAEIDKILTDNAWRSGESGQEHVTWEHPDTDSNSTITITYDAAHDRIGYMLNNYQAHAEHTAGKSVNHC